MADINFDNHPQFFTATILQWKPLLKDDDYKDIILNSLLHLKEAGSIKVYAFVIMPNHIHLIWQIQDGHKNVQLRFLKFKFRLIDTGNTFLKAFEVNAKDRQYQFWERNSLSVDLWTPAVFKQKLEYIHNNPIQEKWHLTELPEDYKYSSAKFYYTGDDEFDLLDHYNG